MPSSPLALSISRKKVKPAATAFSGLDVMKRCYAHAAEAASTRRLPAVQVMSVTSLS
jgi:hypothetical protein